MLNSFCHYVKPHTNKLNRFNASQNLFHYQYRRSQIGAKSQSRSQSTLNPHIDTFDVSPDTKIYEPQVRQNIDSHSPKATKATRIETSIRTQLNDSLIPSYLHDTYWWAYTNPSAVKFWERQWLVDAILWGNFNTLKKKAISEINNHLHSRSDNALKQLNVTQIACVYGNFSTDLITQLLTINKPQNNTKYNYKIVDIAPVQIINTKNKVDRYLNENYIDNENGQKFTENEPNSGFSLNVDLYQNDSTNMVNIGDNSEDITYLFFLLHEQPKEVRLKTIEDAMRITKEDGMIVIVDYHKPISNINPFKYIMRPVLTYLEPFAIDLWNEQVVDYIEEINERNNWNLKMEKELFFNGLYQKIVVRKCTK